MRYVRRYIWRAVLIPTLAILGIIISLDCLFNFIHEAESLRANYHLPQALLYVLTTIPSRFYEYLPLGILLGALVGLGLLANHGELVVIRAAGVSTIRVSWMVLRPVLFLIVLSIPIGEYLAPYCEQMAVSNRTLQRGGGEAITDSSGFWHREGNDFIHINTVQPNGVLYGLTQYRFNKDHQLEESRFVERAIYQGSYWALQGIHGTLFTDHGTKTYDKHSGEWHTTLNPELLDIVVLDPSKLGVTKLWTYSRYLKKQGLEVADYMLAFWQKLLMPLATVGMVLIAISFVFGPLREVTMGLRVAAGIVAGLIFHYGQQFFGYMSLVFHADPLIAAVSPSILCLIAGLWLLARSR